MLGNIVAVNGNELTARSGLSVVSAMADDYARRTRAADYKKARAVNTWNSKEDAIGAFVRFLGDLKKVDPTLHVPSAGDLLTDPATWRDIGFGLVAGFKNWLLEQGYAIGTVNNRLTGVRTLARLAFEAGHLSPEQATLIAGVKSISYGDGLNIDEGRRAAGGAVRVGTKKAQHVRLTPAQRNQLKTAHPDTPQGRRDRLMMALLLDHGLRVSEVVGLAVGSFDLNDNTVRVWRKKTKKLQTLELSTSSRFALLAYMTAGDCPTEPEAKLLRASLKSGALTRAGMTESGCAARVAALGSRLGIDGLSPHDCRHSFATTGAKLVRSKRASLLELQEAGGWASLAMVRRYVEEGAISNSGLVNIDDMS